MVNCDLYQGSFGTGVDETEEFVIISGFHEQTQWIKDKGHMSQNQSHAVLCYGDNFLETAMLRKKAVIKMHGRQGVREQL